MRRSLGGIKLAITSMLAGIIAGAMFAPRSGKDTRKKLKRYMEDRIDQAKRVKHK